jgi:hypothetical protein
MRYQVNQELLNGATIRLDQDKVSVTSFHEHFMKDNSGRYLKFWGNDYPYLNDNRNCAQGCLPIPENSEAQRFIRSLTGYPPVK